MARDQESWATKGLNLQRTIELRNVGKISVLLGYALNRKLIRVLIWNSMLPWVVTTPLGRLVVPEV